MNIRKEKYQLYLKIEVLKRFKQLSLDLHTYAHYQSNHAKWKLQRFYYKLICRLASWSKSYVQKTLTIQYIEYENYPSDEELL
ncbi:hypothetical protein [Runella zeae]|uniref:hypothetical protein n=1 Tax=Runella zeae TaxID=94255 RepID=UPI0012F9604E|nr:hypothetical protein [Runella zeae]